MTRFSPGFIYGGAIRTPLQIFGTDLASWHKADAGVTLSGSSVTDWADQSGNGVTLSQGTASARPSYSATGFNSLPGISFNPANDGQVTYLKSGLTALAMGSNKSSAFAVCNFRALNPGGSGCEVMDFINNGQSYSYDNTSSVLWMHMDNNASPRLDMQVNFVQFYTYTGIATSTNYRIGAVLDGTNATAYVNNAQVATAAKSVTLGATGRLCVGAIVSAADGAEPTTRWRGTMAECITLKRDPTAAERTALDNYFKSHWNL